MGGLGGEESRWKTTVEDLTEALSNVPGDVALSAATLSYLGPFTSDYRKKMMEEWLVCESLLTTVLSLIR